MHYYSKEQDSEYKEKQISYNGQTFITASGVFSKDKVDKGTQVLIENAIIGKRVLDLGCAYGAVGIALAKEYPKSEFILTDYNKRAVSLAKKNIKQNNIKNASAVQGDCYENVDGKFDTILLNPPQSAGKDIYFRMIEQAPGFLSKKGTMQLVVRHNKGGNIVQRKLEEVFGNCEITAKKAGYWIYTSTMQ